MIFRIEQTNDYCDKNKVEIDYLQTKKYNIKTTKKDKYTTEAEIEFKTLEELMAFAEEIEENIVITPVSKSKYLLKKTKPTIEIYNNWRE